jgi:formylglycine-generating enzyme required for sulfatase activity
METHLMRASRVTLFAVATLAMLLSATTYALTVDTVPIDNPGSGDVDYQFEMGTTEVTNAQWVDFLNTVDPTASNSLALFGGAQQNNANGGILRDHGAADGSKFSPKPSFADKPVIFVTIYDAMRFTNWLHNGQGSGDTESGAYTLDGNKNPENDVDPFIQRESGATWALPSYEEWYKAGFYDPRDVVDGGVSDGGGFWTFATQSNDTPVDEATPGGENSANWNVTGGASTPPDLTDAGGYTLSSSYYGTFDQSGNVMEWTDSLGSPAPNRWVVGGSWTGAAAFMTGATRINGGTGAAHNLGFRVVNLVGGGGNGPACDLTGDSSCDLADIDSLAGSGATAINDWLTGAATENGHASPYLPSDSDLDRDVDLTDFNLLASNFNPAGSGATFSTGDGNGDGSVNLSDYNTLAGSFNPTGYAGTTAVPEPTTWVLGLLGLAVLGVCRRLG